MRSTPLVMRSLEAMASTLPSLRHRHVESLGAYDERRFVFVETGAAVLLDAQVALRHTQHHTVVQHHGAIDHELHEAERLLAERAGVITPVLGGDQRRQPALQQPVVQPVDFPPLGPCVRQEREQDVECVEHDPPCAHGLGLRAQRRQHAAEIERAGLDQVGRRLCVDEIDFLGHPARDLPAETLEVGHDAVRRFLEGHEDARLGMVFDTVHEELQREDRLARARPADQQGRPAVGQPAAGHFVEAGDAGRCLGRHQEVVRGFGVQLVFPVHCKASVYAGWPAGSIQPARYLATSGARLRSVSGLLTAPSRLTR